MNLIMIGRQVGQFTMRNAPTILTVSAVCGVGATAVSTGMASVKASRILEQMEYQSDTKPTTMAKVKAVAPSFVVPALMCGTTIACVLFAHNIHVHRQAALAAAYSLADSRYKEYRDKVIEEIGEKKENRLHDEIAQKHVNENPPSPNGLNVIQTKFGNVLFMDSYTSRYFYSSYEAVETAKIELSKKIRNENSASLNDWYDELEIPHAGCGDELGWNIWVLEDFGEKILPVVTNRTTMTPTPEKLPCTVLDYDLEPLINFDNWYGE